MKERENLKEKRGMSPLSLIKGEDEIYAANGAGASNRKNIVNEAGTGSGENKANGAVGFLLFSQIPLAMLLLVMIIYKQTSVHVLYVILAAFSVALAGLSVLLTGTAILFLLINKRVTLPKSLIIIYYRVFRCAFPFFLKFAGLLRVDKDAVRRMLIDAANQVSGSDDEKYYGKDVMILLPHCLQNTGCTVRSTFRMEGCKRCGRCNIGEILQMAEKHGVDVFTVPGGTAARNLVYRLNPRFIISVACERDLASGMMDVGSLPVYGIINERPEGPCANTRVNVDEIRKILGKKVIPPDKHGNEV